MALPRSLLAALVVAALAWGVGACDRNKAPPQPPTEPDSSGIVLRHAARDRPVEQDLELQLTQTRLGQYLEADVRVRAELRVEAGKGDALRTSWALVEVPTLELTGTVEPGDVDRLRTLLLGQGKGAAILDAHGLLDAAATDADPLNTARDRAVAAPQVPAVTGALLMSTIAEQLRLPRLPVEALELDTPVELAEESETVVTDLDLVLPTTTVHRFTLRKVETIAGARVAEIEVVIASVAEPEVDLAEPEAKPSPPAAELESRAEGTLIFDLDGHLPVSLELSRTESFRFGDKELERTLQVRATFASP
ncbi:MAG: hypothetical protein KDK70_03645 [Myxococcales bacterium]|nr:hypothetical protein [Myxococcales bacterium]